MQFCGPKGGQNDGQSHRSSHGVSSGGRPCACSEPGASHLKRLASGAQSSGSTANLSSASTEKGNTRNTLNVVAVCLFVLVQAVQAQPLGWILDGPTPILRALTIAAVDLANYTKPNHSLTSPNRKPSKQHPTQRRILYPLHPEP